MQTAIVDAILGALVLLALINRPGKIVTVVTATFIAAISLGPILSGVSQEAPQEQQPEPEFTAGGVDETVDDCPRADGQPCR